MAQASDAGQKELQDMLLRSQGVGETDRLKKVDPTLVERILARLQTIIRPSAPPAAGGRTTDIEIPNDTIETPPGLEFEKNAPLDGQTYPQYAPKRLPKGVK